MKVIFSLHPFDAFVFGVACGGFVVFLICCFVFHFILWTLS